MKKIKAAIAGLGFIGPAHIEALRRLPNVEVIGVADMNLEMSLKRAAELGIEKAYASFEDLLADSDVDCVHICTPNNLHFEQAKKAIEAGKHVVCEKPLATTTAEAMILHSMAVEAGIVHAVHFNLRYYPLIRQMKILRENGELGEIYSVIGTYLQDWLFYATDYNWRLEPDKSGESRAIADIGSHLMDLMEYITGLKAVRVMADFTTVHKTRKKPLKAIATYSGKTLDEADYQDVAINTEDFATVIIQFSNGNKGVLTVSQVAAGRKNRVNLEIAGSNQTFAWCSESPNNLWIGKRDGYNQHLMRDPSLVEPGVKSLIDFPGGHNEGFPDTSKQLFKEVYAAITANKMPSNPTFPTFADGLRILQVCDKIVESNKKQAWVAV